MMSPDKQQLTVRLTQDLNEKLTIAAKKLGISRNAYIQLLLTKAFQSEVV